MLLIKKKTCIKKAVFTVSYHVIQITMKLIIIVYIITHNSQDNLKEMSNG